MMKIKKLMRAFVVGASIFTLAGCGAPKGAGTNGESEAKDTYPMRTIQMMSGVWMVMKSLRHLICRDM